MWGVTFDNELFSNLTIKDVPSEIGGVITEVIDDGMGNLWIASTTGLYKYDGYKVFDNYNVLLKKEYINESIISLYQLDKNRILLGTRNRGLYLLNLYTRELKKQLIITNYENLKVFKMLSNGKDELWLLTDKGLINIILKGSKVKINSILEKKDTSDIVIINEKTIAYLVNNFIYVYNRDFGHNTPIVDDKSGSISLLFTDKNNNIWYSSNNFVINSSNNKTIKLPGVPKDVYADKYGMFWIVIDGLWVLNPKSGYLKQMDSNSSIIHINQSYNGDLILGTNNQGVKIIKNYTPDIINYKKLKNYSVTSVLPIKDFIYVGTTKGLKVLNRVNGELTDIAADGETGEIFSLHKDKDGLVWIGAKNGVYRLYSYSEKPKLYIKGIHALTFYEDNRILLFGTKKNGLYRFNYKLNRWGKYTDFNEVHICSISRNSNDELVICTFLNGFFTYKNNKWENFASDNKLISASSFGNNLKLVATKNGDYFPISISNYITSFLTINDNEICVVGKEGLDIINLKSRKNKTIDYLSGITWGSNIIDSSYLSGDGDLFIGRSNGLVKVDIGGVKQNSDQDSLVVESFWLKNKNQKKEIVVGNEKRIKLRWPYNGLEFSFMLNSRNKERQKYRYRLLGFNDNWISNSRFGEYADLPYGNYTLQLQSSSPFKELSDHQLSIDLVVSPPIWHTWQFWLLISTILITVFLVTYKIRFDKARKSNIELNKLLDEKSEEIMEAAIIKERSKIARDLHDAVSQTLFSASITADVLPYIMEKNYTEGLNKIEELKNLTASAQREMKTLLYELRPVAFDNTSIKELLNKLIDSYRNRETIVIKSNIEVDIEMNRDIKEAFYRITQESINNCLKHSNASLLTINLVQIDNSYKLAIADDGIGFDLDDNRSGMGLEIMKERANMVGAKLSIDSGSSGTYILLSWGSNEDN